MKILIVCQYFYPENFAITNIATSLVSFGHQVTVVTGKPNYGYGYILPEYKKTKYEEINGVRVFRVKLHPRQKSRLSIIRNYLSFWYNAKRFVSHFKEEFDVVYSMSLSPVISIAPAIKYANKYKIPHVLHCLDLWPESTVVTSAVKKDSLTYRFLYKWSKGLYSKCDKILISSPSFENYFCGVLHTETFHLAFVPQPPVVSECHIEPVVYSPNTINIVYCGNIGSIQLINLIPEAMNAIKDKTNINFHIIGMGKELDNFKSLIEKYNLSDRIKYYGPMPAKKASSYFVNADALYVSLKNDEIVGNTIPSKLFMYMAFKKPIIAMEKGDGKTILEKANGSLFVDESSSSLADALIHFASLSSEEKEKLGSNNYQAFIDNYSVEKISRQIEKELASMK